MGQTHITTCNNTAGGGLTPGGSNVISFNYVYGTQTATISTDQPAVFNAIIPMVKVDQTYFVSDAFGNDATAQAGSMELKYKTYDAAMTASGADGLVFVMPGTYTSSTSFTVSGSKKVYFMPGATIDYLGAIAFIMDPGQRLEIRGFGNFQMGGLLAAPGNPNSGAIPNVYVECSQISSGTGAVQLIELTSMIVHVRVDQIREMQFTGSGWFEFCLEVDEWSGGSNGALNAGVITDFDGLTKVDQNGPRNFVIKGRTRQRVSFRRSGAITATFGVTLVTGGPTANTEGQVYMDCDTMDSFFLDIGTGIIRWYGNTIHRRSGLAGNEIPWMFCSQTIVDDSEAPYFEHVEGDWVSGKYNGSDGGVDPQIGLNNELISIRCLGTFVWNGRYKNSGTNVGLGAWPILQFINQNSNAGTTYLIFNGEFANTNKDAPLIQHQDIGGSHRYKYIFKTVTCENGDTNIFTSNVANIPLYIYHSLTMNHNYSTNFIDAMSSNRTIIDRDVTVYVPEYVP